MRWRTSTASLRKGLARPPRDDGARRRPCRARTRPSPWEYGEPLELDIGRTLRTVMNGQVEAGARASQSPGRRCKALRFCTAVEPSTTSRCASSDYNDPDHDDPAAGHELVDVLGGALSGREAGRSGNGSADSYAFPARSLRCGGVLDARTRAADSRAPRSQLGHGRSLHQPAGRVDGRRALDPALPVQLPADPGDHGRSADGLLRGGGAPRRVADGLRRDLSPRRRGDLEAGAADHRAGG